MRILGLRSGFLGTAETKDVMSLTPMHTSDFEGIARNPSRHLSSFPILFDRENVFKIFWGNRWVTDSKKCKKRFFSRTPGFEWERVMAENSRNLTVSLRKAFGEYGRNVTSRTFGLVKRRMIDGMRMCDKWKCVRAQIVRNWILCPICSSITVSGLRQVVLTRRRIYAWTVQNEWKVSWHKLLGNWLYVR